jgi:O-antigen ligase
MNASNRLSADGTERSTVERIAFGLLWIVVFSIPGEKSFEIPGFGTITKLLGIVAIAGGVMAMLASNRIRVWNQIHLVMLAFILWSGMTYVWSRSPEMTSDRFISYLQLFGMVLLIWQLCISEQEQLRLLQAYALGVCVSGGDTVIRFLLAKQTYYQRYASEGFDPNDLALTCCIAIPMAYYLSIRTEGWSAWLYRMVIGLALMTILLSASRAGAVASLAALSLIPWTYRYVTRRERAALVAATLCLAAGLAAFVPASSWSRLSTAGSEFSEGTLNSRTLIWKTGLDALRESPFQGIGAGAFPVVSEAILAAPKETRLVAHNSFLSVLTETGIVGFTLFSILLGMLAFYVYRFPQLERRFWTVTLVTWAIGVSTLTWEQRKPTWLLFSLILVGGAQGWPREAPDQLQGSAAVLEMAQ